MKLPELHPDFLTKPLAHRGLHDALIPENSRAAFLAAIDAGYGIELDLQLSADGEAMVFHDYNAARLTGISGPIRQKTSAQLQEYRLSNDESIPTLAEILAAIDGKTPVLLELKDQDGALGPDIGILEKRTAELCKNYTGPVAVMSFNPHAIYAMQKYAPHIPRGLVTGQFLPENWRQVPEKRLAELMDIPDFIPTGSRFISHRSTNLNAPRVAEIKAAGNPVLCWTIKTKAQETTSRKIADNITFEGYLP